MATLSNPKDNVGRGGSGYISPEDRFFAKVRTKSRSVRDGRDKFTSDELNKVIAQLMLER